MVTSALVLSLLVQSQKALKEVDATALDVFGGRIYVGTTTGSVIQFDARTAAYQEQFESTRKETVGLVDVSSYGVAWIEGPGSRSIRSRVGETGKVSEQALIVRTPENGTITIDLRPAGVNAPVQKLAWLGPRVVLMQDFGAAFYNARTNAVELPQSFLPSALAREVIQSRVEVSDPYLLTVKPVALRRDPRATGLPYVSMFTAYKFENNRWSRRAGFASNAFDVQPIGELNVAADGKIPSNAQFKSISDTFGFDASGVAAIEGESLLDAPLFAENWETSRKPLPIWLTEEGRPDPLWLQTEGDDVWWWTGNVLVKQSRSTGLAQAFLPWNEPTAIPRAFLADATGVWVATNKGVRRVDLGQPEVDNGYGGFVRVPLGPASERTDDKFAEGILRELYRWRFATPDLAGDDGSRMVSEVLKANGVLVPADRAAIAASPLAIGVRDELRPGDVLISSKGLAVYIGNGRTVELKDGLVKNGDIWSKPSCTVRRFQKTRPSRANSQGGMVAFGLRNF